MKRQMRVEGSVGVGFVEEIHNQLWTAKNPLANLKLLFFNSGNELLELLNLVLMIVELESSPELRRRQLGEEE